MTYTNDIYASFAEPPGGGVAVTPSGDTAPTTYITGTGISNRTSGLVAILPDGSKTYVANPEDNTVSVIDNSTNTAKTGTGYPIDVGTYPVGIVAVAAANGTTYVLVANYSSPSISVIDPSTDMVSSTITSTDGLPGSPTYMAVTPDGTTAYVTHQTTTGQISAIDLTGSSPALKSGTGYPVTEYLSDGLEGIAITPDGTNAYVAANPLEGAVDVIDLTVSPPKVKTGSNYPISISTGALAIAVRPDGKEVWVLDDASSTVSVIGTASDSVTHTFSVGGAAHTGVAFSADSTLAYVTNNNTSGTGVSTISVINTDDRSLNSTITFSSGCFPNAIAINQATPTLPPAVFLCSDWFGSTACV